MIFYKFSVTVLFMSKWLKKNKYKIYKALYILIMLLGCFYSVLFYLSYKAADILTATIAQRQLFPGVMTIGRINATPAGRVFFEDLLWTDENGNTLVRIPEGQFSVKISDILTGHIGTHTLEEVTIDGAYIHLVFNDQMELQNVRMDKGDKDKKDKDKDPRKLIKLTGPKGNRTFDCRIALRNSTIEADSPDRHFVIGDVNIIADVHTRGLSKLDLRAGHFYGTVEAQSLRLRGTLNFKKEDPTCNMSILVSGCNPRSLNAGVDIDDPATISADVKGPLSAPVIDGNLKMDRLDITALVFTNVESQLHYEKGVITVPNLTAEVFGGDLTANGKVDIDNQSYSVDMVGKKLQGGIAAHDLFLRCDVDLNLHMDEERPNGARVRHIYGDFRAGKGKYHSLPFRGISGSFSQDGKNLQFRNVVISMFFGDVSTDAFNIINGKLHLGKIKIDYLSGKHSEWRGNG